MEVMEGIWETVGIVVGIRLGALDTEGIDENEGIAVGDGDGLGDVVG